MPEYYIKITDKITLWCEVLGDPEKPKILFISGAGSSGISLWNEIFCPSLIEQGFCVIRFDQRDTGRSTHIDFNKDPYTLSDMAYDIVKLLRQLNIDKVHIIGNSLGGFIAQMLAIAHPELFLSLTIISSTCDLSPVINEVTKIGQYYLNPPKPNVIQMLKACLESTTDEECRQNQLMYETISDQDKLKYSAIIEKIESRTQNIRAGQNHLRATLLDTESRTLDRSKLNSIIIPTLIIHGTEDPLFPLADATIITSHINKSVLCQIQDMGHSITPNFCEEVLSNIIPHISTSNPKMTTEIKCS